MSKPNKCIKDENGNEMWISRSSVVIPVVFKLDSKGDIYTLIEKRGPAVTHTGEWCCPCGYIDWDETLEEACEREVFEETGVQLDPDNIKFFDVSTNKYSRNQAIDHWYECWVDDDTDYNMDKIVTKDEILDLHWLKVAHISYLNAIFKSRRVLTIYKDAFYGYNWAFKTHKGFIVRMLKKHFNKYKVEEII